jgi:hypothetical protein
VPHSPLDVKRKVPQKTTVDDLAEPLFEASTSSTEERDPSKFIQDQVQALFVEDQLTPYRLEDLQYQRGKRDYEERSRIKGLVST